jgi:hypothetical protein
MTTAQKIIRTEVGLPELAKELGNVSRACRLMGYSRDSFYRFKEFYRVAFRKKLYRTLEELQADLDAWLREDKRGAAAPGAAVLRQDTAADVPGQRAAREGETPGTPGHFPDCQIRS